MNKPDWARFQEDGGSWEQGEPRFLGCYLLFVIFFIIIAIVL